MSRRESVFWGWGEPGAGASLPDQAAGFLRSELGVEGAVVSRPVELDAVRLAPAALGEAARAKLVGIVGEGHVRDDAAARVGRCRGKSYLDLLRQRAGDCEDAPDAVVTPGSAAEVQAVLYACSEEGVAVVPFGGGTSVVGGLEPLRGRFDALVSLDLGRLDGLERLDERSHTAWLSAGTRLPEADHALAQRGFTLGHTPQSYEWATVGGCVATRSAGQSSTGHGRIDENVVALRCATPAGELATLPVPATAAGPALKELVIGSEGVLGAITGVALRVHPLPASQRFEGWFARSFDEGTEALRALVQAGLAPDVARLSDEAETRMSLAVAGSAGAAALAGRTVLRARGYADGCVLICGWEGDEVSIALRYGPAAKLLKDAGALGVGRRSGQTWLASRYAGPHLRDDLLDRGVLVETLETATTWSNLQHLRASVTRALEGALSAPLVLCHASHVYATGASLYFTALAAQDRDDPVAQWQRAKRAATDAIVEAGGTITHHHAVGADHAPWLTAETGPLGHDLLRVLKERCDPAGVMNPGKLLA
ncbi:MAG TPA: FAD-binding oxidoreductase [Solirubrobacteraceae bacterium]|nr:FAD-binding oxidoreductase [Solirubrobacteraceae bacterium]